jgi:protein-disulfide isomerase
MSQITTQITRRLFTRRHLLLSGAALAAIGIAAPAMAQEKVDPAELHKPPSLGDMALGADDGAKVTVVEYASATCPHCAAFHKEAWGKLKAEYIDTKKIRFIFREFPLNDAALAAFMIARAAPKESYFPLIGIFFETLETWAQNPGQGLLDIAKQAGFSEEKFNTTLKDQNLAKGIMEIHDAGVKFGVKGTPTFFINGVSFEGERTFEAMKAAIDPLL